MRFGLGLSAMAPALVCTIPAQAQEADAAALRQELAAMRQQMERLTSRIDVLESQLAEANAARETAQLAAAASAPAAETRISWKGAPEIEGKGGWSFKPRGRLQFDAGTIRAPDVPGRADGFGSEVRRARLGVEGTMPGGFGYKFEADFAGNEVEVSDALVSYEDGGLVLTVGQHNPFQGLEELTSSRFSSFIERAAFTDAFGFERRLGLSAQWTKGDLLVQGGLFSDNLANLSNKSWSADGRVVLMPKLGEAQLHLAGSVHLSDLNDAADAIRYRQRPFLHFTGSRFIDTGTLSADRELGFGLEGAVIAGRLHGAAESYWQRVKRPAGLADPTFFGGYAEVGYFLTRGDRRRYKKGAFDRVKPAHSLEKGGIGAIEINLRFDYLDLTDAGVVGGTQKGYAASLIWTPTDYTRFMINYGRMQYANATGSIVGDTDYGVDAFGMRAQLDF